MKKIIIPFDGGHFSEGAFAFANSLNKMSPVFLSGVFLPQIDYARFFFFPTAFSTAAYITVLEDSNEEGIEINARTFERFCRDNSIEYRVHKDLLKSPVTQLKKETRFGDLMVIGSEVFYKSAGDYGVHEYLKEALHSTECPVVIVPEKFNFPSHIVLAYDGSASSVFAIKQFANLLPELCQMETFLVYAADEKHQIPDLELIEELASRHFRNITINKLPSDNKKDINNWFSHHKDALVVSGSFGRSGLSELFKRSFIMDLIKQYKTPVFIAHQ